MSLPDGYRVDPSEVVFVGEDLQRPECVLCRPDGSIVASDARGGVTRVAPDGTQHRLLPTPETDPGPQSRPNGLAMTAAGDLIIADFGCRRLFRRAADGRLETLLSEINGRPLGQVNFVLADRKDRLWLTISTERSPFIDAFRPDVADGSIIRLDANGAKVVAQGLAFPNEIRFDAFEDWLYVAETTGRRIRRFPVLSNGDLGPAARFGPERLTPGFPDGIAFDAAGNLWVAMVVGDTVLVLSPDGECRSIFGDGDPAGWEAAEKAFEAGQLTPEIMGAAKGRIAPLTTSVAFGGADLRTVYLGSLAGSRIASFRSPVPGLAMTHWRA